MERCKLCGKPREIFDLERPYCLRCEKVCFDVVLEGYHEFDETL